MKLIGVEHLCLSISLNDLPYADPSVAPFQILRTIILSSIDPPSVVDKSKLTYRRWLEEP